MYFRVHRPIRTKDSLGANSCVPGREVVLILKVYNAHLFTLVMGLECVSLVERCPLCLIIITVEVVEY